MRWRIHERMSFFCAFPLPVHRLLKTWSSNGSQVFFFWRLWPSIALSFFRSSFFLGFSFVFFSIINPTLFTSKLHQLLPTTILHLLCSHRRSFSYYSYRCHYEYMQALFRSKNFTIIDFRPFFQGNFVCVSNVCAYFSFSLRFFCSVLFLWFVCFSRTSKQLSWCTYYSCGTEEWCKKKKNMSRRRLPRTVCF